MVLSMAAKIVFFAGLLLLALTLVTLIAAALAPELTDNRASYRDSFPVIMIGSVCSCLSYLILAIGGILLVFAAGKKPDAGAQK